MSSVVAPVDLAIRIGGREYGSEMKPADRFEQGIPEFLIPMREETLSLLALIRLDPVSLPNRDVIYGAYAQDVVLLQRRLDDFQRFLKAGILASVKKTPGVEQGKTVQEQWEVVEKYIPPFVLATPLIDLSAERAALPTDQLLVFLQEEARSGVDRLLRRFCFWLDLLVWKEYVGLVELLDNQVGHYFYFRRHVTEEEVAKSFQKDVVVEVDISQPYGEQITYRTTNGRTIRVTESLERHDHHIVRVKVDALEEYPDRLPERVCDFLEKTPLWLRCHLRIVSGTIVQEVIRSRVAQEYEEHSLKTSEWKGSPVVGFGSYAMPGWNVNDLAIEPVAHFVGQKVRNPARRKARNQIFKNVAIGALIVTTVIGAIRQIVVWENRASAEAYQAFYSAHAVGRQEMTIAKNQGMVLPGGQPLYYLGTGNNYRDTYAFTSDPKTAWSVGNRFSFSLPDRTSEIHYGTVDLGPTMGIPVVMHVLSADEKSVTFTVDDSSRDEK